jgi:glyoxylase-like metal-dependent hydrolase (beta-lactamase superfamily II)
MFIKRLVVGPLESNCYLVADEETREGLIVDPGDEGERILKAVAEAGIVPRYLINTHGHIDHIGANNYLKGEIEDLKIGIHEADSRMLIDANENLSNFAGAKTTSPPADFLLREGDEIALGKGRLKVVHTPGHTPGGICLLGEREIFTGDTLFAGSVGRTDLPGGSMELLMKSLREKLMVLPEGTVIYPGHGEISTIGREKVSNPFI